LYYAKQTKIVSVNHGKFKLCNIGSLDKRRLIQRPLQTACVLNVCILAYVFSGTLAINQPIQFPDLCKHNAPSA